MKKYMVIIFILMCTLTGIQSLRKDESGAEHHMKNAQRNDLEIALFAGGCFWCTESDLEKVKGVVEAISGYAGGLQENPTYSDVSAGGTGHVEAVKVLFDPEKITYKELLNIFWMHVDPTDPGGQFVDRGSQYRSVIFYLNEAQKRVAEKSKEALIQSKRFDKPIATEIIPFSNFFMAEDYHQDYYKKNPLRYKYYRFGSGRDQFLKKSWNTTTENNAGHSAHMKYAKHADSVLKKKLTSLQYQVTRQNATEPPFKNKYWNNKKEGIYVDIASGEPLFSSINKFKSGTGWPSFTKPLVPENIVEIEDRSFFMKRTEVRSRYADSHLGHVFSDGPMPTGLRYCINSASLRFVPKDDIEKEGYGDYKKLFK